MQRSFWDHAQLVAIVVQTQLQIIGKAVPSTVGQGRPGFSGRMCSSHIVEPNIAKVRYFHETEASMTGTGMKCIVQALVVEIATPWRILQVTLPQLSPTPMIGILQMPELFFTRRVKAQRTLGAERAVEHC